MVSKLVVAFSSQGVNFLFKKFTEERVITVGARRVRMATGHDRLTYATWLGLLQHIVSTTSFELRITVVVPTPRGVLPGIFS